MVQTLQDLCSELFTTDFMGGTLVEYKNGRGFDAEWDRSIITKAVINKGGFDIETMGQGFLATKGFHFWTVRPRGGVFYLSNPYLYCYALASKGVGVPLPGFNSC